MRIENKPMVYASELHEFPFTSVGRNYDDIYHYDEDGMLVAEKPRALVEPEEIIEHMEEFDYGDEENV
jgi:hypothetical protein